MKIVMKLVKIAMDQMLEIVQNAQSQEPSMKRLTTAAMLIVMDVQALQIQNV